jgi:hypothetical protein
MYFQWRIKQRDKLQENLPFAFKSNCITHDASQRENKK